ncbi:hypothetical protein DFH11DRAFT_1539501 [Phellopilus nigrolimitatus]|nr:hypothetical protein DFH11DRAFT_1539501 [Phellopilus nigrolimitatus]
MPSLLRTLVLAMPVMLGATLIVAPVMPVSAMASPIPLPMPLRAADYNSHFGPIAHATRHHIGRRSHLSVPVTHTQAANELSTKHETQLRSGNASAVHQTAPIASSAYRAMRRDPDYDSKMTDLASARDGMVSNSQGLQELASQSASQDGNSATFQQNAAAKLTAFHQSAQTFDNLFGQLGADKGLANYDKTNILETLLKDYVNSNKDALSAVTAMIYNIPGLGPVLGPIVYDIKCLIDSILDVTENITDGLLKPLVPLLNALMGQANDLTCSSGLKLLGFCLL